MRARSGHTFIEILVVCGLVGMLMTVVMLSWFMLNRSSRVQVARIDARQQLRTSMAVLRADLQSARYIYAGYNGYFAGRHYTVPNLSNGVTPVAGDLVFAMPQTVVATNMLWKICGMTIIPRSPPDPNNPGALDIIVQTVENVGPAALDDPADLLSKLPSVGPASTRRFDAYIEPGSYGLILRPAPYSVFMKFAFKLRPTDVSSNSPNYFMTEQFETEVFLRNQAPLNS